MDIPSSKLLHNHRNVHHFSMGQLTISIAVFNGYITGYIKIHQRCYAFSLRISEVKWLQSGSILYMRLHCTLETQLLEGSERLPVNHKKRSQEICDFDMGDIGLQSHLSKGTKSESNLET